MSFNALVEKVESSEIFKTFIKGNPDALLGIGFFVIDFQKKERTSTLDYVLGKKVVTFSLGECITTQEDELMDIPGKTLELIEKKIMIDLDETEDIVRETMREQGISQDLEKMIAIIQRIRGKQVWNVTCLLAGLRMITVLIDSQTGEVIQIRKKSIMDFMSYKKKTHEYMI